MKIKCILAVALVIIAGAFFIPVNALASEYEPDEYADLLPLIQSPWADAPTAGRPFTPNGTATVVDNSTDEDGKEFFTFTTPAGNVFFLVIDRARPQDNVYFLNAVTEQDLMPLASVDSGQWTVPKIRVLLTEAKPQLSTANYQLTTPPPAETAQ